MLETSLFWIILFGLLTLHWILLNYMEYNYEKQISQLTGVKKEEDEFKIVMDKAFPFVKMLWKFIK